MTGILARGTAIGVLLSGTLPGAQSTPPRPLPAAATTIHVAPPAGEVDVDRANIVAALERARPGDTLQFATGTYHVGEIIRIETPRLTMRGHGEATVLRGCDPAEYEVMEREFTQEAPPVDATAGYGVLSRCGLFTLIGGHATIRDLTFEYSRLGLVLGCCEEEGVFRDTGGGYRIEGNTFRNSGNSIRGFVSSTEPTVIRDNRFINTFHALSAGGSRILIERNEISVPDPALMPLPGHPGFAIAIGALPSSDGDPADPPAGLCDDNIIADNRIDGHPDGILLLASPGAVCRRNEIRGNTIRVRRVAFRPPWPYTAMFPLPDPADTTFVGVPISLFAHTVPDGPAGSLEETSVTSNRVEGAEGVGIEIVRASRNRIANNTIVAVTRRVSFPGNNVGSTPEWRDGNGAGIWISPGSDGNEIAGNTFTDIAGPAVIIEGDGNTVILHSGAAVHDAGRENRVTSGGAVMSVPAALPVALANDHRTPAGRMVDGELQVELEAVETAWYPRGADGPRVVTVAFAEAGRTPSIPGPLLRAPAGTPIRVTVRNTLDRPILVRGLLDRATMASVQRPPGIQIFPAFTFGDSLVLAPGATREARFTPTAEVSSFYYGRTLPPAGQAGPPLLPAADPAEGAFLGAFVIDPPATPPPSGERVFVITQWASREEPGNISFKMMINGLSWPFTERLEYAVGDTVRWRVINANVSPHPLHLHGFYFNVDGLGDAQADTTYSAETRPLAVTQLMAPFTTMRMMWVPERAGNWLFHCHLIRHMHEVQRFRAERQQHADSDGVAHDGMAGLVLGITVHEGREAAVPEPAPVRRIDLWTGQRPGVFEDEPELGFVVQEGPDAPARDSTVVPGSPIVLTRGEPTEIVVHNRLDMLLSVHWHGLELRSLYDGVGHWSGSPGATRAPIEPGDSARVLITPPRAGTFMYHTHGESGPGLAQGLYGPFLVLERASARDPDADRLFVLAARGARRDAAPAINGRVRPEPQRFTPHRTYRLRFMHISPDEVKRVRLLKDGEPVRWRPLARDGADLPPPLRDPRAAELEIGVGETFDVEWTPDTSGLHVLEVRTLYYPATGASVVQRVPFAVGDVPPPDLELQQGADLPAVPLTAAERARYAGTYTGDFLLTDGDPEIWRLRVWEQNGMLRFRVGPRDDDEAAAPFDSLIPLGEHTFQPALDLEGLLMDPIPLRIRFGGSADPAEQAQLLVGEDVVATFTRDAT